MFFTNTSVKKIVPLTVSLFNTATALTILTLVYSRSTKMSDCANITIAVINVCNDESRKIILKLCN